MCVLHISLFFKEPTTQGSTHLKSLALGKQGQVDLYEFQDPRETCLEKPKEKK